MQSQFINFICADIDSTVVLDERIDILNSKGEFTGKSCLKSEAHKKGLWHLCVHIWLYNEKEEVILQKRALSKDSFPGFWDVSVAGHIGSGEDPGLAGTRELSEELGVNADPAQLEYIGSFSTDFQHSKEFIDREYHKVYICKLSQEVFDFQLQREEVAAAHWMPLNVLQTANSELTINMVPYPTSYLELVFSSIIERIEKLRQ